MNNSNIHSFLASFFNLFGANIANFEVNGNRIEGMIIWRDEDEKLSFSWETNYDNFPFSNLKILCDFLFQNNLISIDKITISENNLIAKLSDIGWSQSEAERYINYLSSINIKMGTFNEDADFFHIHW